MTWRYSIPKATTALPEKKEQLAGRAIRLQAMYSTNVLTLQIACMRGGWD